MGRTTEKPWKHNCCSFSPNKYKLTIIAKQWRNTSWINHNNYIYEENPFKAMRFESPLKNLLFSKFLPLIKSLQRVYNSTKTPSKQKRQVQNIIQKQKWLWNWNLKAQYLNKKFDRTQSRYSSLLVNVQKSAQLYLE